jgi:N-acetylglucosamine-6-sulfatase
MPQGGRSHRHRSDSETAGRAFRSHVLEAALLVALLLWAGSRFVLNHQDISSPNRAIGQRPNIVFILTDDMKASDLDYMPNTQNLLANQGVQFTEAWVTRSLCCPSRATILRGQYAHNHKVWGNVPPSGGFWKFYDQGLEDSTIATWLDDAGYNTIFIGKYLNPYGLDRDGNYAPTTHVPPGWDRWYAWEGTYRGAGTKYDINENGKIVTYYRSETRDTDLYAQAAENLIRQTSGEEQPFFMYLSPNAPHNPAYSAPRHAHLFTDTPLPKPPSFNEKDVSDKPAWVRNKPRLTYSQVSNLTQFYRKRLRALQSVDEMVERLVQALRDTGELSNTYIVFTSDNGIYLGEHRLKDKAAAYNASPRIPLIIRGPSVPQGVIRSQTVLNNDLAPTFADLGGVQVPSFVDGRSLKPLLTTCSPASWRTAFLVEHRRSAEEHVYVRAIPNYDAVRTSRYHYVEYPTTGERELYDLNADPHELTNIYASASPALLRDLKSRLEALKSCAGAKCKRAEDGG